MHDDHNEAIGALNWLAGCREPNGSPVSVARTVTEDHACVYARIRASLDDYVGKRAEKTAIPGEEAALRDVLRGRGLYEPVGDINLASFTTPANLSLPTSVHDVPYLDDVTRGMGADQFTSEGNAERMLLPPAELTKCTIVPFWDPVLKRDRKKFVNLYRSLLKRGLLLYAKAGTAVEQL